MDTPPKKARSRKEQMQLDRTSTLHALRQAIARDRTGTLSPTTFLVTWTLLTYMGEAGEAFPSMTTLAAAIGMHERTVRDHLERVVTAGFLSVRRDGRRKSNVYTLANDRPVAPSNRASDTDQSLTLTGAATPLSHFSLRASSFSQQDTESPQDTTAVKETGPTTQSQRVNGARVSGADDPTIHVEENHPRHPRQTLVRSPFGQSDLLAQQKHIEEMTERVFDATHGRGRERSRKTRIARALRELAENGVDLGIAVRGTIDVMHGADAYNDELDGHAAAEKILRERRWESWIDDDCSAFS